MEPNEPLLMNPEGYLSLESSLKTTSSAIQGIAGTGSVGFDLALVTSGAFG
jgi:hypothetical protein